MRSIILSEKNLDLAEKFAQMSLSGVKSSYQTSLNAVDIIAENIRIGKLGEIAAYLTLRQDYDIIKKPDFTVYPSNQKNWDADLKISPKLKPSIINLHIKTQSTQSRERYTKSWAFQCGKYRKDKLLSAPKENDWVCLVSQTNVAEFKLELMVPFSEVKDLFREPKISAYASEKKILYWDDIKNLV